MGGVVTVIIGVVWAVVAAGLAIVGWAFGGWVGLALALALLALARIERRSPILTLLAVGISESRSFAVGGGPVTAF